MKAIIDRRQGHADIWECSFEEFKEKALPEYLKQQKDNNIMNKILKLATSFLRIKFEDKELKGTIKGIIEQGVAITNLEIRYKNGIQKTLNIDKYIKNSIDI
jgi:hypothetical protein